MKKRSLIVAGMLAAVALVIVGAAATLQTRAGGDISIELPYACLLECVEANNEALAICAQLHGRERAQCRRNARTALNDCYQSCW